MENQSNYMIEIYLKYSSAILRIGSGIIEAREMFNSYQIWNQNRDNQNSCYCLYTKDTNDPVLIIDFNQIAYMGFRKQDYSL